MTEAVLLKYYFVDYMADILRELHGKQLIFKNES